MGLWFDVARGAAALNAFLLLGLGYVWARNYWEFRSKHTLGLLIFAVLMFGENALALYFFNWHPVLSGWFSGLPELPQLAMMSLRVLMLGALAFLLWVTWD